MYNVLISIVAGFIVFSAMFFTGLLNLGESIVPAVLGLLVAYFLLARRTFKQLEKIFTSATKALQSMPPKLDLAVKTMEQAYALAPWQFLVRSQVDTQIGMVYFLQKKFDKALPYLERSARWGHWMGGAMLGVIYYKKKRHDDMKQTMELVTSKAKKQGLAWNLYAYLLCQVGERDKAQSVLTTAMNKTNKDQKVQEALLAVQNNRKIKMKSYKEQWYQFHLERPPAEYQQVPVGTGRVSRVARRGRW